MEPKEREAWNVLFDEAEALVRAYDGDASMRRIVGRIENLREAVHAVRPLELPPLRMESRGPPDRAWSAARGGAEWERSRKAGSGPAKSTAPRT